jgi:hypothetical protein
VKPVIIHSQARAELDEAIAFYAELEEAIWIVAVAHGKRRPDYWRRRRFE